MVMNDYGRRTFLTSLAASSFVLPGTAAVGFSERTAEPIKAVRGNATNVLDFGAIGDGRKLCTVNIQAAINACADSGGGKVVVPPGRYLTGPVFLKSNLQLEVQAGATLLGSTSFADYPTIQGWWEGLRKNHLRLTHHWH